LPRETVKGGVEHGIYDDDDVLPEGSEKGWRAGKPREGAAGKPSFKVAEDSLAVLKRVTWLA
jgi:hypothetical protein